MCSAGRIALKPSLRKRTDRPDISRGQSGIGKRSVTKKRAGDCAPARFVSDNRLVTDLLRLDRSFRDHNEIRERTTDIAADADRRAF